MMALPFTCDKHPASGSISVVVSNHPLGTAAETEMLAVGGNAVDAAVAALLTLTVVEPMMVRIAGGGLSYVRMADSTNVVFDALSCVPAAMPPDVYTPVSDAPAQYMDATKRRNQRGAPSVAVPSNSRGWHDIHARFGALPFADLIEPVMAGKRVPGSMAPMIVTQDQKLKWILDMSRDCGFSPRSCRPSSI